LFRVVPCSDGLPNILRPFDCNLGFDREDAGIGGRSVTEGNFVGDDGEIGSVRFE
jgi:hypothetical protein